MPITRKGTAPSSMQKKMLDFALSHQSEQRRLTGLWYLKYEKKLALPPIDETLFEFDAGALGWVLRVPSSAAARASHSTVFPSRVSVSPCFNRLLGCTTAPLTHTRPAATAASAARRGR